MKKFLFLAVLISSRIASGQIAIYVISGANLPTNCSVAQGQIYFKTTGGAGVAGLYQCGPTDNSWTYVGAAGGGISGSGTAPFLPLWAGATSLGVSAAQDSGTLFTIGEPLLINGTGQTTFTLYDSSGNPTTPTAGNTLICGTPSGNVCPVAWGTPSKTGTGLAVFNTNPSLVGFSATTASSSTDGATLGAELTGSSGWTSAGWTGSYNAFSHTAGAIFTGPTYVSGSSACTNGTQAVTFTNGGGSGATGTITVSGNVPTGAVTITAEGSGYTTVPTTATVATCTGTGTYSGGALDTRALDSPISGIAANQYYQVVITLSSTTAGSVTYTIGGSDIVSAPSGTFMGSNATYTSAPGTNSAGDFIITPTANFNGTVAVSVKLITPAAAAIINVYDSSSTLTESLSQTAAVHQNIGLFTPTTLGGSYTGNGFSTLTTTGSYETSLGANCPLCSNTTGTYNTAIGGGTLRLNTTGWYNTAIGDDAMAFNTTGYDNSALGVDCLYHNTTGFNNTCAGFQALITQTTGNGNTANGFAALELNVSGNANTAVGANSLAKATTSNNTAVGSFALGNATSGVSNTAVGQQAMDGVVTGSNNVAFGANAGFSVTGSQQGTFLGGAAGYTETPANAVTTANNVVYVGYQAGPGTSTQLANAIGIGFQAHPLTANTAVIGNSSVTDVFFGSTTPAAKVHSQYILTPGIAFASLSTCTSSTNDGTHVPLGALVYCTDCKNVTDDTTGTYDAAAASGGHGTNVLCTGTTPGWRNH